MNFLFWLVFAHGIVPKWSVVLDRHNLIKSSVIHEKDFFLSEAKIFFGNFLIAESSLDLATSYDIFTVKVVIVFE